VKDVRESLDRNQITKDTVPSAWPGRFKNRYNLFMTALRPPAYIVWSTDQVDLSDPFQRRWYLQQVLTRGRIEDIRILNLDEVATALDEMILPEDVRSLWQRFLETRHAKG
jgi:hypothetical protein